MQLMPDKPQAVIVANSELPPHLFDYLGILNKFRLTFLAIVLCALAAAVFVSFKQTPKYRSSAQLEVQELNQNFMNLSDVDPAAATSPAAPDSYVQVQVQVLESEELLRRVIARLHLDQRPSFVKQSETPMQRIAAKWKLEPLLDRMPPRYALVIRQALALPASRSQTDLAKALEVVRANLHVKAAAQSNVVQLFYSAPDPKTPVEFLNVLAEEFIAYTMDVRWSGTERTARWLNTRLADLRENLEKSERRLQDYARSNGILYTNDRQTLGEERLRQVQAELSKSQADRAALQSRYERLQSASPEQLAEQQQDLLLRDYYTRLADLKRQDGELSATMKPEHVKVRQVRAQIGEMQSLIHSEQTALLRRIANEFESSKRREQLLGEAYRFQFKAVAEQSEQSIPIDMLRREVESNQRFYQDMLQKVNAAGVATALRASNIHVIEQARETPLPYSPKVMVNLLAGLLGGVFFATLACFSREAVERRHRKLWQPGESLRYLDMPELGVIPSIAPVRVRRSIAAKSSVLGLTVAPEVERVAPSALTDSLHTALDALLLNGSQPGPQVITITSALPEEGKSTITHHLALALASLRRRVLVIDADFRNPTQHRLFSVSNEIGLSDLLEEPSAFGPAPLLIDQTIQSAADGVSILPSGPLLENAPRLLASSFLPEILRHLRRQFDAILIDTPPAVLFPDARIVGRQSDGVVLVVRANRYPIAVNQEARELLLQSGNSLLGTILNDFRPSTKLDYLRQYSAYAKS